MCRIAFSRSSKRMAAVCWVVASSLSVRTSNACATAGVSLRGLSRSSSAPGQLSDYVQDSEWSWFGCNCSSYMSIDLYIMPYWSCVASAQLAWEFWWAEYKTKQQQTIMRVCGKTLCKPFEIILLYGTHAPNERTCTLRPRPRSHKTAQI